MKKILISVFIFFTVADAYGTCLSMDSSDSTTSITPPKEVMVGGIKRLYFYSSPNASCKQGNVFVINDDKLLAYYKSNGYVFVNYFDRNGKVIDGWVAENGLTNLPENKNNAVRPLSSIDFQVSYKNSSSISLGVTDLQFNAWAKNNKLNVSEPTLAGIDENNWSLSFSGGYVVFNEANAIIKNRLKYAVEPNSYETYLADFNISGSEFKTSRGISIGDEWNKVSDKYGIGETDEGDSCMYYPYFNKKITFCKNNNRVESIELTDIINN